MSDEGFDRVCDEILAEARARKAREASAEYRQTAIWLKAIRLAPTVEIARMLLLGEPVPASALDPYWRKAYGIT